MANFFTDALKDIGILKKGPQDLQAQQKEDAEKKAAATAKEIEKAKRAVDPETNRQARADEKALARQILDTQDLQVKETELWKKPGDQELKSPAEVRKFLLSGEHPESYVRWVNQNVDKWMDEGKHVFVNNESSYFAVVTDAQKKPDMAVFEEYKQLSMPKAPPRLAPSLDIGDVEEARRLLEAEINLKRASEGMPIPKGFSPELWDHIRKTNGNDLQHTLDNLDSMYQNNQRLSKTPDGDIDTTGFHQWAEKDQLRGARTAQNWISSQVEKAHSSGEDAQEQAWKPLATAVPGIIRGYYESPGAIPLTVDVNGKLDVTNLVNWSHNQGGFEKYDTGKANVDDKNALKSALQGLREQDLVTDNSLPEPRRTVNAAVTNSADANHFTAVYNHIEYNITINNGVASATPAAAPAPAASAPLAAGTPPATGTELPLDMTTNGTSFSADGGTTTGTSQPIKLTLTGTTDGKTAIITGVTGVNTVTGVSTTLDAAEAARIINHGDTSQTAATFDVKGGKLAFKTADPHTSLEQLGADVYVAAQKQVADVNSVLEVKKGAGNAISIPTNPVEINGKNYNLTFNGTSSADGKTATITNATLVDDAGKTTTIEGDKLNAVFQQKSGAAITYNIDNSNHVAISSSILPAAASTIVSQNSSSAAAASTAPAVVNPATARPEEDKENFLEKNKFGIGAGILGLLAGMILGGGGFMGLLLGLIVGAVALFIGGMADPHGFSHSPAGPAAAVKPDLAAAKAPEQAPVVQGPPAPDKAGEKKADAPPAPPAPSAVVAQNGTQLTIDYKEQYKGDDGKMQDATLHLAGDIKDKQFIATSATVTGIDPKVPGKEIAVDPKMLQTPPINLQPINLSVDDKGAVDIKDAQQKASDELNGKINAYRVEYLKENAAAKRPDDAPPLPAPETPAVKPDPELLKQIFGNQSMPTLGSLGVKSADDTLSGFSASLKDVVNSGPLNGVLINKVPDLKYGGDAKEATSGLSNAANKQPDTSKTKGQQGQGQQ